MEAENINRLNAFLAKLGTSCDILPQSQVRQLLKIDEAIQSRISSLKTAEDILKQQSINVLNIASDTNIARKTFYNNEVLRLYVEHCAAEIYDDRIESKEKIKDLKEKIADLESTVQNFILRDVETEKLRKELETTQRELSHFMSMYEDLKHKYENLVNEKERFQSTPSCKVLIPKDGKLGSYFGV